MELNDAPAIFNMTFSMLELFTYSAKDAKISAIRFEALP
jgi:hypothetical protein